MTNDELKKKIVDIVLNVAWEGCLGNTYHFSGGRSAANAIADALIAAGVGDVWEITEKAEKAIVSLIKQNKEAEHRAARAERALKNFAENITCEDCPFFSDCASSEKMEDLIHSNYCFAEYLRQTEKELAEEGK